MIEGGQHDAGFRGNIVANGSVGSKAEGGGRRVGRPSAFGTTTEFSENFKKKNFPIFFFFFLPK